MTNQTNLVSSANVYPEQGYSEFTTVFRVPFKQGTVVYNDHVWKDILGSWTDVCVLALNLRMESCVSMLLRNKDNVILSNDSEIIFKKTNGQIHSFSHEAYVAMDAMVVSFTNGDWECIKHNQLGIRQLLKALYWIPEEERKDHGGFGFGQLIDCLTELVASK